MNPTPEHLAYLAIMMMQLRLDFTRAVHMAAVNTEADNLWALSVRDAIVLMHALEAEKRRRGYPQVHLL